MNDLPTCPVCGEPIGVYEPSVVIYDAHTEHPGSEPSTHQSEMPQARYHLDCRFLVKVDNERRQAA